MSRIFLYELKRLLLNKFFPVLIIIAAWYGRQIMSGNIILGVANTAPFSGWSYGTYLAKVLPILLVALLFFISFLYTKQEKNVETLTGATPADPFYFRMLRYGAITLAFALIAAVPIGYSLWFYKMNFHFSDFGSLILPAVVTLAPAILFVFGAGILGGRCHPSIIFILMGVVILMNYLSLPYAADLFGGNFLTNYPASLDMVEPAFSVPTAVLIGKSVYGLVGVGMIWIAKVNTSRVIKSKKYAALNAFKTKL